MYRFLLSPRLLWVAAFAGLLALPSQAQERARNTNGRSGDRGNAQELQIDRRNDLTVRLNQTVTAQGGERFQVQGAVHVDVRVRGREGGDLQADGQISGSDVTVTRLRDQRVFRVTGTEQFSKSFRHPGQDPVTASTVVGFNLVSQGQVPQGQAAVHRLLLNLRGELDRQGELNVRVTDVRIGEPGGRGSGGEGGRYERDFNIDGQNARTYNLDREIVARGGERFHVEGDLALVANVERQGDDRLLLTTLFDGDDLTITWLDNRQVYEVEGSEKREQTLREPDSESASFSTVVDFTLVPVRRETINTSPEYRLYLRLTGDVNRDGNLTLRVSSMEIR